MDARDTGGLARQCPILVSACAATYSERQRGACAKICAATLHTADAAPAGAFPIHAPGECDTIQVAGNAASTGVEISPAAKPAADDAAAFNILDFVCFQRLFQAGCP
jgi:hypothetical protein